MVLNTSALIAMLRQEPDAALLRQKLKGVERCLISTVSLLEASMVIAGRYGTDDALQDLDDFIRSLRIEAVAFDIAQQVAARHAWLTFGRGRHAAGLNFGDCAAYALAKTQNLPLLFKGNDFAKTDVLVA